MDGLNPNKNDLMRKLCKKKNFEVLSKSNSLFARKQSINQTLFFSLSTNLRSSTCTVPGTLHVYSTRTVPR